MAEERVEPKPIDLGEYKFGFHDDVQPILSTGKGLNEAVIRELSAAKNEPEWMLEFRLKSFETFKKMPMQTWGADLSEIDFDDLIYYQKPSDKPARSWDEVPEKIKETFERIGIPEAERAYLAGASAQYESEVVYHNMKEEFEKLGIIFTDTDSALKEYPDLFKQYFAKLVPPTDNKLAALNSAVWSGGTFIYVPKGVKVDVPLQTYFRINNENTGQFERTLIIVDEGASVHYVEGCTAPTYSSNSLHAAIVEIFANIGFSIAEGPEIEDDWHNFTALNLPEYHPARDMQDTFFIQTRPDILLHTHTSSVEVRYMEQNQPPIRIIAPGRVYRNEDISARSHCLFHQIEGLYIDTNVSFVDLKQTLLYFTKEMFGKSKIRLRPSYFPFTEPSAEMDIYWGLNNEIDYRITKGTGWLEIMGCGMTDPNVLKNCNIDPEKYSGFAFGIGLERVAMLLYQIGDIRAFYENDVRFLEQFKSSI